MSIQGDCEISVDIKRDSDIMTLLRIIDRYKTIRRVMVDNQRRRLIQNI